VDDSALSVEIVEAKEDLLCNLAHNVGRNTAVLVSLDKAKEVLTEHLKHHAHVGSVGTIVTEVIHEAYDMCMSWVRLGRRCDALEKLNFIQCCFGVVAVRLDHLERDVTARAVKVSIPKWRRRRRWWSCEKQGGVSQTYLLSLASHTVEK
jgi:hypothetical protein